MKNKFYFIFNNLLNINQHAVLFSKKLSSIILPMFAVDETLMI